MNRGSIDRPAAGRWLVERARRSPQAPALLLEGEVVSYAELEHRASDLAVDLERAGIGRGDVVAALFDNGLELPVLLWALHELHAVLLPLNIRLTPAELVHPLSDSGAVLLVHGTGERARQAKGAASSIDGLASAGIDSQGGLADLVGRVRTQQRDDRLLAGALALLYTSGTTGRPKGAVLSTEAFLASARGSQALLGAEQSDRWLVCMPIFHVGGLSILIRSCLAGSAAIVHPRFDPDAVDRALDHDGVTLVSLVASGLSRLLDVRGDRPSPPGLRCVLLGGGPTPVSLLERARTLGFPVAPTYGLTEAASQVATRLPYDPGRPLDGRLCPLPGTEIAVLGDRDDPVALGTPGEIVVRGKTLMSGYLGLPDATERALRNGWLHTGDIGVLDAEGRLAVLDRRDDLIVSGGENIYPAEVEAVLLHHPAVAEALVTGIADERYGARPVAWWVPIDPTAGEPDLAAHCAARLAPFKRPVAFHRRESLPRNASGKLLRRVLRSSSG